MKIQPKETLDQRQASIPAFAKGLDLARYEELARQDLTLDGHAAAIKRRVGHIESNIFEIGRT